MSDKACVYIPAHKYMFWRLRGSGFMVAGPHDWMAFCFGKRVSGIYTFIFIAFKLWFCYGENKKSY